MENPFQDNPPTSSNQPDTPATWTHLCDVSDLPSEDGHYIELANRSFAILRVVAGGDEPKQHDDSQSDEAIAKQLRVLDDRCPHAGASLSAGHVEEGCIICPWHHWAFDVNSGACPDADVYKVRTYEVRVVDGRVEALI